MVDSCSSLNIIPISNLEMVGFPRKHMVEQSSELSSFGGDASLTLCNLMLIRKWGPFEPLRAFMLSMLLLLIICFFKGPGSISTISCPPLTLDVLKL